MRKTQMHNHETEIVSESVSYEEPRTGQILEPYLRFIVIAPVHQRQPSIFDLRVNIERCYVLPINTRLSLFLLTIGPQLTSHCHSHHRMSLLPLPLTRTWTYPSWFSWYPLAYSSAWPPTGRSNRSSLSSNSVRDHQISIRRPCSHLAIGMARSPPPI